jgi:hypothetical protein
MCQPYSRGGQTLCSESPMRPPVRDLRPRRCRIPSGHDDQVVPLVPDESEISCRFDVMQFTVGANHLGWPLDGCHGRTERSRPVCLAYDIVAFPWRGQTTDEVVPAWHRWRLIRRAPSHRSRSSTNSSTLKCSACETGASVANAFAVSLTNESSRLAHRRPTIGRNHICCQAARSAHARPGWFGSGHGPTDSSHPARHQSSMVERSRRYGLGHDRSRVVRSVTNCVLSNKACAQEV